MARSQFALCRGHQTAGRLTRWIAALIAGLAAAALPSLTGSAWAEPVAPGQPGDAPVTIAITSMSPSYAAPGRTIIISGQVRDVSRSTLRGLSVQLLASSTPLASRSELESYAQGSPLPLPLHFAPVIIRRLAVGATATWRVHLPVSALQLSCFGVYPLTVQLSGAAGLLASDPTLLPYWPGRSRTCASQRPRPSDIAWVWPLIDRPHQGACPGLEDNSLAGSVAPGGRLSDLLAVGRKYASQDQLTWVVDPALLDNVRTMTQQYLMGSSPSCAGGRAQVADPSAAAWLKSLSLATAGHTVVATPYADVDVAALTQHVSNRDSGRAFAEGQRVAGLILHRTFSLGALLPGSRQLANMVWPADGVANYALLEYLGSIRVSTVILESSTMQPVSPVNYTPGAVTSTPDGLGTQMRVLLADDAISRLLGSRDARSHGLGAIFRVRQLFLAETAMIAAERSGVPRPIVVAPPRRWNPARKLASGLLAETASAPWLRPSSVGQLLRLPPDHLARSQPRSVSPDELSGRLLRHVAMLDGKVALLESILVRGQPNLLLYRAAFGVESSAWRGGRRAERQALAMLSRTSRFVNAQWKELSVGGFADVTLGGTVSTVRMHISNRLGYPVRVKLVVTASNKSVKASVLNTDKGVITVPSGVVTVKLAVTASTGGAATIRLSLRNSDGRPLPVKSLAMHIRATQFGTLALVIFAAALAVFVIASAARAIRLGRPAPPQPAGDQAGSPDPGPPGTGPPDAGPADRPGDAEKPDNVDADQSELTPAGPAFADQGPPAPGRPMEGRR